MSILSRALWREIRRRPAQFLSVAVVIALGVGMFNASFDAFLLDAVSFSDCERLKDPPPSAGFGSGLGLASVNCATFAAFVLSSISFCVSAAE